MTPREIDDKLGRLGIVICVKNGQPCPQPPRSGWSPRLKEEWQLILPHIQAVRSEFLVYIGCNLWDQAAAITRMYAADTAVETNKADGTHESLQAVVSIIAECYRQHDMDGLNTSCTKLEALAIVHQWSAKHDSAL